MPHINTFSVETSKGVRSFHLHQGDICESPDDAIVTSTHANPRDLPTGAVIESLQARYNLDLAELEPLIVPRGCFGTFLLRNALIKPTFIVVRIPAASSSRDEAVPPLEVFKEAIWTLFGSFAALEYGGKAYRSISLPVLAGRRGYPIRDVLTIILENAVRWLRISQATEAITLYVFEEEEFGKWYEEMDHVLGRKYFETMKDSVLNGLRLELLSLLKEVHNNTPLAASATDWLEELSEALAEGKLRFQQIAAVGRKIAEFATVFFMEHCSVTSKGNLYEKIKVLNMSGKVAPWVKNYLLTLKDFGNEQVHVTTGATYRPSTVTHDDLLTLLCNISRMIKLWAGWDNLP